MMYYKLKIGAIILNADILIGVSTILLFEEIAFWLLKTLTMFSLVVIPLIIDQDSKRLNIFSHQLKFRILFGQLFPIFSFGSNSA